MEQIRFAYFGGEPLGVPVLEALKAAGYVPSLVVASPDRKSGRGQRLTPPPVKVWALAHNIPVIQPDSYTDPVLIPQLTAVEWNVFIVVAFNHILPKWLIELPKHKCLNVHPSLLPLLRGASPIRSAILRDMREEIGVSVMQLDTKMDHGPMVTQKRLEIAPEAWPIRGPELDETLARLGGDLLAACLPGYLSGDLEPQEQEHEYATYCGRFEKSDGELTLDPHNLPVDERAYETLLKIYAYMGSPGTFFIHNNKRIKINDAVIEDARLKILSVTPEGKSPQSFTDWTRSL